MKRASKKEARGDIGGGSGKGAVKDRRGSVRWVPVVLEEEFPAEFRYTALLATLLFGSVLSIYVATVLYVHVRVCATCAYVIERTGVSSRLHYCRIRLTSVSSIVIV